MNRISPEHGLPRAAFVMAVVFLVALLSHIDLAPLEETHWDAPIYVQLSKRAAETQMLGGYRQHAHEIELRPSGAHWYFTRIGHILILGEVTKLFGSSEAALVAMQWLYRFFMALSVTLCIAVGLRLVALFRPNTPDSTWLAGYAFAAATYVASDSFRGLHGHILSEPPAFATSALFALVLLRAIERRSLVTAALAGGLLFLLFFIRADAVLTGLTFIVVLAATLLISRKDFPWACLTVTSLVGFAAYAVYAYWFSPLVNPITLVNFSDSAKLMYSALPPIRNLIQIVVAGGLLWVGAIASLARRDDPVVRFAAAWLALALMPMVVGSLTGGAIQVRMAYILILPLFILAGEGWSWILRHFVHHGRLRPLVVCTCILALMSFTPYAMVLNTLREIAMNQLSPENQQYVFSEASRKRGVRRMLSQPDSRLGLLLRPIGERLTFQYQQAHEISDIIYGSSRPSYLVWPELDFSKENSLQEFVGLIRYFGNSYPESADLVLTPLPNARTSEPCTDRVPTESESVVFCNRLSQSQRERLRRERIPLYVLHAVGYPPPDIPLDDLRLRLSAPPYTLYEVMQ